MLLLAVAALTPLAGCSNASFAQFTSIGSAGHITCYSGGKVVLDDESTGKIATESGSDGWYYQSAKAYPGKLIRVSGQCVIVN